ncbi:hypothetical protein BH09PLA1_BH09PLA1_30890 [soil metagenome]
MLNWFPSWRAIPFLVPGWLYLPAYVFGIPLLPKSIDENVLAIILQAPLLLFLLAVIPVFKRWTTWPQVGTWVVLPNLIAIVLFFFALGD